MSELKKYTLALSFIATLICIKFIVIPVIDWQDAKQGQLVLLERKVSKINDLMHGKDQIEDWGRTLNQQVSILSNDFYLKQDAEKFKRKQQKKIETEIKDSNLTVTNIGWNTTVDNKVVPLTQYSVSYSFTGQGTDVINYLLSMNAAEKFSEISEFNATFARQYPGQIGRITIRLRRTFYMKTDKFFIEKEVEETI